FVPVIYYIFGQVSQSFHLVIQLPLIMGSMLLNKYRVFHKSLLIHFVGSMDDIQLDSQQVLLCNGKGCFRYGQYGNYSIRLLLLFQFYITFLMLYTYRYIYFSLALANELDRDQYNRVVIYVNSPQMLLMFLHIRDASSTPLSLRKFLHEGCRFLLLLLQLLFRCCKIALYRWSDSLFLKYVTQCFWLLLVQLSKHLNRPGA